MQIDVNVMLTRRRASYRARTLLDARITFDMALQTPFQLAFFSTIGLSAEL